MSNSRCVTGDDVAERMLQMARTHGKTCTFETTYALLVAEAKVAELEAERDDSVHAHKVSDEHRSMWQKRGVAAEAQLTALRDGLNTVIFEWRRNFISSAEAMCRIGGLLTKTAPDVMGEDNGK